MFKNKFLKILTIGIILNFFDRCLMILYKTLQFFIDVISTMLEKNFFEEKHIKTKKI